MSEDANERTTSAQAMAGLEQERDVLCLENEQLSIELQNSDMLKQELRDTKEAGKRLSKQRDKLKRLLVKQQGKDVHTSPAELQSNIEDSASDAHSACVSLDWDSSTTASSMDNISHQGRGQGPGVTWDGGGGDEMPQLRTQLGALQLENVRLVKEKRKGDEQRDNLVQELAALNDKCQQQQAKCDRLQSEIQRLSQALSGRQNTTSSQEVEDIELLKAQVRIYEEDCKIQAAMTQVAEKANKRLKAELSEARVVIRELRMSHPRDLPMYPEAELQPVFQQVGYIPRGPGYSRRPLGYYDRDLIAEPGMTRSYSGGYIGPPQNDDVMRRGGVRRTRKAFLTPDMTAVVDSRDGLVSFKSI